MPDTTELAFAVNVLRAIDNRVFHLILLPTEQCNFRCVYCYENFKIGRMQRSIVEAVKKLLENRECLFRS